jgi:hypothetical protein
MVALVASPEPLRGGGERLGIRDLGSGIRIVQSPIPDPRSFGYVAAVAAPARSMMRWSVGAARLIGRLLT